MVFRGPGREYSGRRRQKKFLFSRSQACEQSSGRGRDGQGHDHPNTLDAVPFTRSRRIFRSFPISKMMMSIGGETIPFRTAA